jgi:hypothetical protein
LHHILHFKILFLTCAVGFSNWCHFLHWECNFPLHCPILILQKLWTPISNHYSFLRLFFISSSHHYLIKYPQWSVSFHHFIWQLWVLVLYILHSWFYEGECFLVFSLFCLYYILCVTILFKNRCFMNTYSFVANYFCFSSRTIFIKITIQVIISNSSFSHYFDKPLMYIIVAQKQVSWGPSTQVAFVSKVKFTFDINICKWLK